MSSIDTAAIRAQLAQTGRLHTPLSDDPGFLSDYWRAEIARLCDAIDEGAVAGIPAEVDDDALRDIETFLVRVQVGLLGALPAERLVRAHWLVEHAMPRMKSLNNQFSATWVPVAEAFLSGKRS